MNKIHMIFKNYEEHAYECDLNLLPSYMNLMFHVLWKWVQS